MDIKNGDKVICITSGVKGIVIKQYFPTACEQQTMIQCADGRKYHAPTKEFRKVGAIIAAEQRPKFLIGDLFERLRAAQAYAFTLRAGQIDKQG